MTCEASSGSLRWARSIASESAAGPGAVGFHQDRACRTIPTVGLMNPTPPRDYDAADRALDAPSSTPCRPTDWANPSPCEELDRPRRRRAPHRHPARLPHPARRRPRRGAGRRPRSGGRLARARGAGGRRPRRRRRCPRRRSTATSGRPRSARPSTSSTSGTWSSTAGTSRARSARDAGLTDDELDRIVGRRRQLRPRPVHGRDLPARTSRTPRGRRPDRAVLARLGRRGLTGPSTPRPRRPTGWAAWSSPTSSAGGAWSATTTPTGRCRRRCASGCSSTRSGRRRPASARAGRSWCWSRPRSGSASGRRPPTAAHPDGWLTRMRRAPLLIVPLSNKSAYLDRYAEPDKGWTDRDESPLAGALLGRRRRHGGAAHAAHRRRRGAGRLLLRHPARAPRRLPRGVRRTGGVPAGRLRVGRLPGGRRPAVAVAAPGPAPRRGGRAPRPLVTSAAFSRPAPESRPALPHPVRWRRTTPGG